MGRYVKKGEKGITILAPIFRRRTDESNEAKNANLDSNDSPALTGFRAVYVFDESMTAGNPLPQVGSISGDPGAHRERIEQFVREQGIALEYSADIAPVKGISKGGKITLLPGAWLYDLLVPHVTKVVVCDPCKNATASAAPDASSPEPSHSRESIALRA